MSQLGCRCGHRIADQTDNLPYKARLLRDQDDMQFGDAIIVELARFAAAKAAGRREEWISQHFLPIYPRNLPDESVISDYLAGVVLQFTSFVYECERCGRLSLERQPGVNEYVAYVPDDDRPHPDDGHPYRVLASERYAREGNGAQTAPVTRVRRAGRKR